MSRINYYLNNKADNKGYCTILLYFSFNTARIPITTNENILQKAWNKKTQRVRLPYAEGKSINDRLDDLEQRVKEMFRNDFRDVAPRRNIVKEKIQKIINPPEELGTKDFINFAETYATTSQKKLTTKKNYFQTINHLKAFKSKNKEYRKKPIDFNEIDLDFYDHFFIYLEKEIQLGKNTIGMHFKNIKVFMKQAFERNLHKNQSFMLSGFRVVSEETDATFLNPKELKKIFDLDLKSKPRYERIRDLFIVGCWTGLRYSDWSQVHQRNIFNEDYLRVKTIKGERFIIIPLHHYVRIILEKYNYTLPNVISNQKLNDYLKEICQLAEINDPITNTMTKAGIRINYTNHKWEKISTHTARRSFATNMYNMNVPGLTIMAITGHKTEKSFLRYIKITPEQHATKLLGIWKEQDTIFLKAV
ncbi:MAG: site-specific integrase [Bacteroidota bacterium]|nr:site-specific integrase [Bacteroidota bacterium]